MPPIQQTIGFLGFGNMGEAIFRGLVDAGELDARNAWAYDKVDERLHRARELNANVAASPEALAAACDVIVLAPKPQDMGAALDALRPGLRASSLFISVAAGVSTAYINEGLGGGARVVRVMPNTPALVRTGATGVAAGASSTAADVALTRRIFEAVGIVEEVREDQLDAVTAVSGSGPAYFFYLAECLAEAGIAEGLPAEQAKRLAAATLAGAGKLLQASGEPPAVLRERVTSPGGTTFAALEDFRVNDLPGAVRSAVAAAAARSRELGK